MVPKVLSIGATALLASLALTSPAAAAPPATVHVHDTVAKQGNKAKILHHYGRDYIVSPSCQKSWDLPDMIPYIDDFRHKVFLNFDGQTLTQGQSNSQKNTTGLIKVPTLDYPAMVWGNYGGKEKGVKDVLEELKLLYGDISVEFVTKRPESGDYTMVMVGGNGTNIASGSAVGLAPLDCKNSNKNDIASVFGAKLQSSDAKSLAYVIAHELGHTFGLEHVNDNKGIMAPALNSQTCCWVSGALSEPPGTCGRGGQQDSKGVLVDNVGAGPGDTIPPKLWFVRPGDGAVLPKNFVFEVTAGDDLRVHHVELFLDGKKVAELPQPPYLARVTNVSDGEHTLKAIVYDWKPNQVAAEMKVTIDNNCVQDGRCNAGVPGPGAGCQTGTDCGSGICVIDKEGKGLCAQDCEGKGDVCPEGTECRQASGSAKAPATSGDGGATSGGGGTWACTKDVGDFTYDVQKSGGGCAVSAGSEGGSATTGLTLLLLGLLAFARRR